jgi:hypothetical protein
MTLFPILVTHSVSIRVDEMLSDDYRMLSDHGRELERWALRCRQRRDMPTAFGEFMAGLAEWHWFMNPISFRDEWRNAHRSSAKPSWKTGPPCSDEALAYLGEYFADIEKMAGRPVGWVLGEEFGPLGGRYHCHALVTGVADLSRRFWWGEAFRRFGRTLIEPFDGKRAATFYAAKYEAKQLGGLHFRGTIAGTVLSEFDIPTSVCGKNTVFPSAELPKEYYRLGLSRWHRG